MTTIDPKLVQVALAEIDGPEFENFAKEFFAAVQGPSFVPLGGVHDDGADGASAGLFEDDRGHHWQFSVRQDSKRKIKETIDRLRESGLDPKVLWYATSRRIPHALVMADAFAREEGVTVQIRDGDYIGQQVNLSPRTRAAWDRHLSHRIQYLSGVGSARTLGSNPHTQHPDVFVFLQQELDRRDGTSRLTDAVVDSLIMWSLEGTDPNQNRLMAAAGICERIASAVPSTDALVKRQLPSRLDALSRKQPDGRQIRHHRQADAYCLPFEARSMLEAENMEDEALRLAAFDAIADRVIAVLGDSPTAEDDAALGAEAVLTAVREAFAERGLAFASWIGDENMEFGSDHYKSLNERVMQSLASADLPEDRRLAIFDAGAEALRGAFYASTTVEREYFGKLARTYVLLFTLQQNPKVIQYFQEMAGTFRLYVGTDQIIRALSERYLPKEDQMTRLMFDMIRAAGATLLLAEPVVNEVVNHIRNSDYEYQSMVAPMEEAGMINTLMTTQVPKILVRAYLYARQSGSRGAPTSWEAYLRQICDPTEVRDGRGHDAVTSYLRNQFGFAYVPEADLTSMTDAPSVAALAKKMEPAKASPTLAEHDALMAVAIYADRRRHQEHPGNSPFGYRTWWLTDESAILSHTRDLVKANNGDRYMMRPDFILNFLALAPNAQQVRQTYKEVFPTLLGIRLSRRMPAASFHKAVAPVKDWATLEEGRRVAMVEQCSNRLMADMKKQYEFTAEPTFTLKGDQI